MKMLNELLNYNDILYINIQTLLKERLINVIPFLDIISNQNFLKLCKKRDWDKATVIFIDSIRYN